jgi:hypothetical protein
MWKFSLRIILVFFNLNSSTVWRMCNVIELATKKLVKLLVLSAVALATSLAPQIATAQAGTTRVTFTEILANALDENTGEFIELLNTGSEPIDLSAWTIVDASGARHGLVSFPGELGFGTRQTVLNPNQIGLILDQDYAGEYARRITELPDQGASLALLASSRGNLSLANSTDGLTLLDGAGLVVESFSWTSDAGSEAPFSRIRDLTGMLGPLTPDTAGLSVGLVRNELPPVPPVPPTPPQLRISELLPNPVGSDSSEWVELENVDTLPADLSVVRLWDAAGSGKFLQGELGAGEFLVVDAAASALSLNNSAETLRLVFEPEGFQSTELDSVSYGDAPEGQSWARFASAFAWTIEPTPGAANILEEPAIEEEGLEESEEVPDLTEEGAPEPLSLGKLSDAREVDAGELVKLTGIVVTPVDLFYKDKFFLVDQSAGIVVRVGKLNAKLAIGERVSLVGTLTQLKYFSQLTLVQDPELLGSAETPILERTPESISKDDIGRLVRVRGRIAKKQGPSFRLAKDDHEVLVSIRKGTGIKTVPVKKGDGITVAGVVLASGNNLVVAPRSLDDLGGQQKTVELLASGSPQWPLVLVSIFLGGSYSFYMGFTRTSDAKSSREASGQSRSYEDRVDQ